MIGIQTRPLVGHGFVAALLTMATIATCLSLATPNHHQHQQQHQHLHPNQAQSMPGPAGHPQAPNNFVQPPAPQPQAQPQLQPQQLQQQPQLQQQQQQLQQQPNPVSGGSGGGDLASNAGKIIATGALMGAVASATSQLHGDSGLSRQTRHLTSAPKTFIDLSHPLHNGTLHWPTMTDIQYSVMLDGERKNTQSQSYYIKADAISASIHSGTHLDAPLHFSKSGWSVEQIPLDRLIDVPVTVIDVSEKVKADRSYNFIKADFLDSKTGEPLVNAGSVVLVYTGISQAYDKGKEAYMGTASTNISEMTIPGFSEEAAKFMVERGVYGVGLDSPSADSSVQHGKDGFDSFNPVAHVVLNSNNIYILENINNRLAELVNVQGARLTIAPLPIVGGSGSQVRLVAIVGHDECHCGHSEQQRQQQQQSNNSGPSGNHYSSMTILITLFLSFVVFLI